MKFVEYCDREELQILKNSFDFMLNYRYLQITYLISILLFAIGFVNSSWANEEVRIVRDNALEVDGKTLILKGVVIPVATSKCLGGDAIWPCGAAATLRFNKILKSSSIQCDAVPSVGQISLARCWSSHGDIAEQLVQEGWAIAVASSDEYRVQEQMAREGGIGIWRGGFSPPQSWRQYPEIITNPILDLLCSSCAVRNQ